MTAALPGRKADSELECSYCGEPFHGRCMHCHRPGVPYEYKGITFDGLHACKGERLCSPCLDVASAAEGVNILVVDGRPSIPPYVFNTVRDRDTAFIVLPRELRGVDGRDLYKGRRKP